MRVPVSELKMISSVRFEPDDIAHCFRADPSQLVLLDRVSGSAERIRAQQRLLELLYGARLKRSRL